MMQSPWSGKWSSLNVVFFAQTFLNIFRALVMSVCVLTLKLPLFFRNQVSLFCPGYFRTFSEIRMEKVRKRPWLPTFYSYIATVVINEKKRSFDVLSFDDQNKKLAIPKQCSGNRPKLIIPEINTGKEAETSSGKKLNLLSFKVGNFSATATTGPEN